MCVVHARNYQFNQLFLVILARSFAYALSCCAGSCSKASPLIPARTVTGTWSRVTKLPHFTPHQRRSRPWRASVMSLPTSTTSRHCVYGHPHSFACVNITQPHFSCRSSSFLSSLCLSLVSLSLSRIPTYQVLGSVGEPLNAEIWRWYHRVIGRDQLSIVDTYWQTETGGAIISPLANVTPMKPGSAALPFFGIEAGVITGDGQLLEGAGSGVLVLKVETKILTHSVFLFGFVPHFCCGGFLVVIRSNSGHIRTTGRAFRAQCWPITRSIATHISASTAATIISPVRQPCLCDLARSFTNENLFCLSRSQVTV